MHINTDKQKVTPIWHGSVQVQWSVLRGGMIQHLPYPVPDTNFIDKTLYANKSHSDRRLTAAAMIITINYSY